MAQRKQRTERSAAMLDWQFPDEEAWTSEPTNVPTPQPAPVQRRGLTEQNIVLLLILVCVAYWLWSVAENEKERSKIALQQRMIQISPTHRAEHNSRTKVPEKQQRQQATLVPSAVTLLTVIAEGQAYQPTLTSQQQSTCFGVHTGADR